MRARLNLGSSHLNTMAFMVDDIIKVKLTSEFKMNFIKLIIIDLNLKIHFISLIISRYCLLKLFVAPYY